jgi:hypothetical protein
MCLYRLVCDIKAYDFHASVKTFQMSVKTFQVSVKTFQVSVKTFQVSVKTFQVSVKTLDSSCYCAFGFGNICFSWSSRKYMTWRRAYIA